MKSENHFKNSAKIKAVFLYDSTSWYGVPENLNTTSLYFLRINMFKNWKFPVYNNIISCLFLHLILIHFIFMYGQNVDVSASIMIAA